MYYHQWTLHADLMSTVLRVDNITLLWICSESIDAGHKIVSILRCMKVNMLHGQCRSFGFIIQLVCSSVLSENASKNRCYNLQCSSDQQGLDSIHFQCIQHSSSPLELDVGYNCRTPLNPLLCQCSYPEIRFVGYQVDHSQLKR